MIIDESERGLIPLEANSGEDSSISNFKTSNFSLVSGN